MMLFDTDMTIAISICVMKVIFACIKRRAADSGTCNAAAQRFCSPSQGAYASFTEVAYRPGRYENNDTFIKVIPYEYYLTYDRA
jgi:hypothetical protein